MSAPRLTPAQLARLLRWAAGINGDRCPDPVYDIARDELDEVVSAARARACRGTIQLPADAPPPTVEPEPASTGYHPPAWLADILEG